jgi:protein-lysine N-methyltransferase EEF2KMT
MATSAPQTFSVTVVHCWSAPRSRSTALLYSFDSRDDTVALDEPLYAAWLLQQQTTVQRPYLSSLQAAVNGTATEDETTNVWKEELVPLQQRIRNAVQALLQKRSPFVSRGVIFCKQMAKFWNLYGSEKDEEQQFECSYNGQTTLIQLRHKHILLIRDPLDVLSSWNVLGGVHGGSPSAIMEEMGILQLYQIYATRNVILVVDAEELRLDPEGTLRHLCQRVEIPYSNAMYVKRTLFEFSDISHSQISLIYNLIGCIGTVAVTTAMDLGPSGGILKFIPPRVGPVQEKS